MNKDDTPIDLLQVKIEKAKENLSDETLRSIAAVDWKKAILDMRLRKGYSFEQLEDLELETELLLCGLTSPDDYPREVQNRLGLSKPQTSDLLKEMNDKIFKPIREEFIKITEAEKQEHKEEEKVAERNAPKAEPAPAQAHPEREEAEKSLHKFMNEPMEQPEEILKNLQKEEELPAKEMEKELSSGDEKKPGVAAGSITPGATSPANQAPQEPKPAQPNSAPKDPGSQPLYVQKLTSSYKAPTKTAEYTLPNLGGKDKGVSSPKPKVDPYREIPE